MAEMLPFLMGAAPGLINMFSPQPQMPGPSGVNNINPQALAPYQQQILQSGFNPNQGLYQIASQQALGAENSDLANKGLLYSSGGNQAVAAGQSQLANAFLQSELQRRIQAYNAALGGNQAAASIYGDQNAAAYQNYQSQLGQRQGQMAGIQSLFGGLGGAYGQYQTNQNFQQGQAQNQNNFNQYMGYLNGVNTPGPTGGMYSGPPPPMNYAAGF